MTVFIEGTYWAINVTVHISTVFNFSVVELNKNESVFTGYIPTIVFLSCERYFRLSVLCFILVLCVFS